jgi:hypothetical protein
LDLSGADGRRGAVNIDVDVLADEAGALPGIAFLKINP